MAIMNNGFGILTVDQDPNIDIIPNTQEDSEIAWNPLTKILYHWDRVNSIWVIMSAASLALNVTKKPLYEYRDIFAEESGGLNANTSEWSFGNGATGFMGLPIDTGWEVEAMYFQADTYPATATVQVDLMNYGNTPSNAAANTIASINLTSSVDGGGQTNNGYKYDQFTTPIPIPVTGTSTVIGFITRGLTGNISDARVGARLRRQIDEFVSEVTLV